MPSVWHLHSSQMSAVWYAYDIYMAKPYSCHYGYIYTVSQKKTTMTFHAITSMHINRF